MKSKIKRVFITIFLICLTLTIVYNIFDNSRVIVKEDDVIIERLPDSFNDFKILQLTDLHGKYYGKEQSRLVSLINSLDYDMIAITGDMNDSRKDENSKAFLDLIDGIKNKNNMFYVEGNVGPFVYKYETPGELSEIGKILETKGCKVLSSPIPIKRGNDNIWISNYISEFFIESQLATPIEQFESKDGYINSQNYYKDLKNNYEIVKDNNDVKILLNHYPKSKTDFEPQIIKEQGQLDYDLSIAGHYHGGQFRMPFIGALYVPDPHSTRRGLFPNQDDVSGLNEIYDTKQYISAGLGSSTNIKLLGFRIFNTPEINIITLKNSNS